MRFSILTLILTAAAMTACDTATPDLDTAGEGLPSALEGGCAAAFASTPTRADLHGQTRFLSGRLGLIDTKDPACGAAALLRVLDAENLGVNETFSVLSHRSDEVGQEHIRLRQVIDGVPVFGTQIAVHAHSDSGEVFAVNGAVLPVSRFPTESRLSAADSIQDMITGLEQPDAMPILEAKPAYYVDAEGEPHLTWTTHMEYVSEQGPELDEVFVDAVTGELIARHPKVQRARFRLVQTANNTDTFGGVLMVEGETSTDVTAQAAYDGSGEYYDYLFDRFGRDSFDDAGAALVSIVHYKENLNNAYHTLAFNGAGDLVSVVLYGDGDGTVFSPLARDLDIVAHEFTHALTQNTAQLIYAGESGALNEAMSDIFAAAVDARVNGLSASTWDIGETAFTPGISGDALRYMSDPAADGFSTDFYRQRYTGDEDNGGVHINSGIANLAFYLLSEGGMHPRGKSNVDVPAQGITRAERIFYRALTEYMTPRTNFQGALMATMQSARDLYGDTEADAVFQAWKAVDVGFVAIGQNGKDRYDVNDDGFVTALDALVVINRLNQMGGPGPVFIGPLPLDYVPSAPYVDVNGDNYVSALDALQVINQLNRESNFSSTPDTRNVWQDNSAGVTGTNIGWDYAMGFHFTPQKDGYVTRLGGFFNGTKRVKLFDDNGVELAAANVTANNDWGYSIIWPVAVTQGRTYRAVAYLDGSGGSYSNAANFPQTSGDLVIEASTYAYTGGNSNAIPTNRITNRMYGQVDVGFTQLPPAPATVQRPWSENEAGTLRTGIGWDYALGYHFTPQASGSVTALGGHFQGAKTVKLFNKATGALLATARVTGVGDGWAYEPITAVPVQAGTTYTVAAYLEGSGASYRSGIDPFPRGYGDIIIEGATYASTRSNANARPTNNYAYTMYGQVDVQFVKD